MGVTSLVCAGDRLASASDDATIAMWKLPELSVEWRSRAHGQLVNQLYLEESSGSLWSASSDGRVKRWSWPELVEQETVDLNELLPGPQALHAIWAAPGGDLVLVGTWQRRLLVLESAAGGWEARALPFASYGGYRLVGLPAVAAVALVGILHPFEMGAYDLTRQELVRLPNAGQAARAAVALDDGRRLVAVGAGVVLDYRLDRAADGRLASTLAVRQQSSLGFLSAAVAVGPASVVVADNHGRVMRLDLGER